VAAADEPGVCKIMLDLTGLVLGARIQQLLDPQPTLPAHERLVNALIESTVPIKFSDVQPSPEYVVDSA